MQNKEQIFLYMKEEIEQLAALEEQEILEEAATLEEQAYQQIREEAKAEASKQLEKELAEISSNERMHASSMYDKRVQELVKQREDYVKTIFEESEKKLQEFVSSEEYKEYLLTNVKRVNPLFENDIPIIYIRPEDMQYQKDIISAFGRDVTVQESKEIKIGGFSIEDVITKVFMDETLDAALEHQYEWFYHNSGLRIKVDGVVK